MIMKEPTISILLPCSSFFLEVKQLLETQVVSESLILRFILHKLVFKGFLLLWSFILHSQEGRHSGALWSLWGLWLVHWLTNPLVRHVRAFPRMKFPRILPHSFHPHFFDLSSKIWYGHQKSSCKIFSFFITCSFRGFTLVLIISGVIKILVNSILIHLIPRSKRLIFF